MFDSIGCVPDPVCLSGVLANDVRVKEHGLLADATRKARSLLVEESTLLEIEIRIFKTLLDQAS